MYIFGIALSMTISNLWFLNFTITIKKKGIRTDSFGITCHKLITGSHFIMHRQINTFIAVSKRYRYLHFYVLIYFQELYFFHTTKQTSDFCNSKGVREHDRIFFIITIFTGNFSWRGGGVHFPFISPICF